MTSGPRSPIPDVSRPQVAGSTRQILFALIACCDDVTWAHCRTLIGTITVGNWHYYALRPALLFFSILSTNFEHVFTGKRSGALFRTFKFFEQGEGKRKSKNRYVLNLNENGSAAGNAALENDLQRFCFKWVWFYATESGVHCEP